MWNGMAGKSWKAEKNVMNAYVHSIAKRGVSRGSRAGEGAGMERGL